MSRFWIYFILLIAAWTGAFSYQYSDGSSLFFTVLFFIGYNSIPLVPKNIRQLNFIIMLSLIVLSFQSLTINPFVWPIYMLLAVQFHELFNPFLLYTLLTIHYSFVLIVSIPSLTGPSFFYQLLLLCLSIVYLEQWRKDRDSLRLVKTRFSAIYDEYRNLKRQILHKEEVSRQEERNQIAREIHDAVGHRLTALLMQLEVARIQAKDQETAKKLGEFKKLAQMSLQDTRKAVSTLKAEEQSGLQAVVHLIRKLESESHLRLSITFNSGILNLVLTNEQSIVLYRAIQEALTNMMKHSETRYATIVFEIIAQRELKFTVRHKVKKTIVIQEGFGLTSMRDRIETIDGKMYYEILDNEFFELVGQFPLEV